MTTSRGFARRRFDLLHALHRLLHDDRALRRLPIGIERQMMRDAHHLSSCCCCCISRVMSWAIFTTFTTWPSLSRIGL